MNKTGIGEKQNINRTGKNGKKRGIEMIGTGIGKEQERNRTGLGQEYTPWRQQPGRWSRQANIDVDGGCQHFSALLLRGGGGGGWTRTFYSTRTVRQTQPKPCQIYFFGLETCSKLLAQTLYFIDLCTGNHESIIFPLSYTYWAMYIFLISKEFHSLKNIIQIQK